MTNANSIPFYTDDITIQVDSSNYKGFLGIQITLAEFEKVCNGSRFSLTDMGEGVLQYECVTSKDFIQGKEVL